MSSPLVARSPRSDAGCVLVVDDESPIRRSLRRLLERCGHRVVEASTAAEARQLIGSECIDVVLLDVGLPGESGLSLLKSLGPLSRTLSVVVLTGSADRRDMSAALASGAHSYLRKSADELTIEAQVELALQRVRDEREMDGSSAQLPLADALSRWNNLPATLGQALFSAWDLRHVETGAHVRRIGVFTEALASALGSSHAEARALGQAAVLHDIGKIAIPDSVLCKPSQLTPEELELMKRHTVEGAKMLKPFEHPYFERAALVALRHHERWDGSGYPDGLRGEETPRDARIVAVVDVYDALSERRCYKPAWCDARIAEFFRVQAGVQFEAPLAEAILDCIPRFKELAAEVAESGRHAVAPELAGQGTFTNSASASNTGYE
jgi:putative two-component system response regulator